MRLFAPPRCEGFGQASRFAQTQCEKFWSSFFKSLWVGRAKPSSQYAKHTGSCLQLLPPAEVEIPQTAFLFDSFFFAPLASKKKRLRSFACLEAGRRVLVATRSRSGSNMPPACYSSPSRRFATSPPTINAPVVSKRKVAKDFRLFKGGRFVKRPYDQEKRKSWITRLRSFVRFPSNLVGTGVLDGPRKKSVCFACGYIPIAV